MFRGTSITLFSCVFNTLTSGYVRNAVAFNYFDGKSKTKNKGYLSARFKTVLPVILTQNALLYPLDRVRTLIFTDFSEVSLQSMSYNTRFIMNLIRVEGFTNLFRGVSFSMFNTFAEFLLISKLFDSFKESYGLTTLETVFLTSAISKSVLYPLDTVLRRYQADSFLKGRDYIHTSPLDIIRDCIRHEGTRSFFKGFGVGMTRNLGMALSYAFITEYRFKSDVIIY